MKKLAFALALLALFSSGAFAACTPGESQCALATYYQTFSSPSASTPSTSFNSGETVYVDFRVKNEGTQPLENMKFFFIGYHDWTRSLSGTVTVATGVDLAPGEEIAYNRIPVVLKDNLPPTEPPVSAAQHRLVLYVSTESNLYFDAPTAYLDIAYTGDDWAGASINAKTRKTTGGTWANSTEIGSTEKFDLRGQITNRNNALPRTIKVQFRTEAISSCDSLPPDFTPLPLGTYSEKELAFAPGETKEFLFEGCLLKTAFAEGLVRLDTYTYYNASLLVPTWPNVQTDTPNARYYNIWADKDYLASGETTEISVEFAVDYADLPPGSKLLFELVDYTNGFPLADREIVYASGLPEGRYTESVQIGDYPESLSNDFRVTVTVLDNLGGEVKRIWGVRTKRFAPPEPNAEVDTDTETATGSCGVLEDLGGGRKRMACVFSNTSQKSVRISGTESLVYNIQISGASTNAVQRTGLETIVYFWPDAANQPVEISFMIAGSASASSLGFAEAFLVLALAFPLVFFILKKRD